MREVKKMEGALKFMLETESHRARESHKLLILSFAGSLDTTKSSQPEKFRQSYSLLKSNPKKKGKLSPTSL